MTLSIISCTTLILGGGAGSSIIHLGERTIDGPFLTPQLAKNVVMKKLDDICGAEAQTVQIHDNSKCHRIDLDESHALSRVVYTNAGYFIVHQDIVGNINAFTDRRG